MLARAIPSLMLSLAPLIASAQGPRPAPAEPPRRLPADAPSVLFGLQVSPLSLPEDIAGSAEQLWASQPREALGLLYRGLLSRLLHDFRLPLKSSNTENEVLQLINQLNQSRLSQFSRQLTRYWQSVAYGHQLPPGEAGQQLCNEWRALFPHQAGRT